MDEGNHTGQSRVFGRSGPRNQRIVALEGHVEPAEIGLKWAPKLDLRQAGGYET